MSADLNESDFAQLRAVNANHGLWREVSPEQDRDLKRWIDLDLIIWLGKGKGYAITKAGRQALAQQERK